MTDTASPGSGPPQGTGVGQEGRTPLAVVAPAAFGLPALATGAAGRIGRRGRVAGHCHRAERQVEEGGT